MSSPISKLIRDKLIAVTKRDHPNWKLYRLSPGMEPDKIVEFLIRKLREEVEKLAEARTRYDMIEEMADIYCALKQFAKWMGIDWESVKSFENNKAYQRGRYDKYIVAIMFEEDEK